MVRVLRSFRDDRRAERQSALRRCIVSGAILLATAGWLASGDGLGVARAGTDGPVATPESQVLLAWRDAGGQAHAGTIDREKFAAFLDQQTTAVEQERYRTRTAAVESLDRDMAAIFRVVRARVPPYADWYFRYWTKYVLMSQAARAAVRHMTAEPGHLDLIHDIESSLGDYLRRQFALRVMLPSWTEGKIEAAYARALMAEHDQWQTFHDQQDRQLVDFVSREVTPVASATALELGRADRVPLPPLMLSKHHRDVSSTYAFQRGLLRIRVKRPRDESTRSAPGQSEDDGEDSGGDMITEVLVDMFSKIVDPMASRIGDLLVSATAGGVAGAMAGGSSLTVVGAAGAVSGAATVVPLTALFGVAVSLASDYAANQFEQSLTRPAFEQNVNDIVTTTEDSIKQALIATLSEHIDASRDDVIGDTAIDRLVIND